MRGKVRQFGDEIGGFASSHAQNVGAVTMGIEQGKRRA